MALEKDEVIDYSGEDFSKFSLPCSVGFLIILIISLGNLLFVLLFPGTFLSIYVSLVIIVIFVLYYSYILTKNPGQIRKFSISNEEIELLLPNKPYFRISWSEFKKLEIRMRYLELKPFLRYKLHFINQDSDKSLYLSWFDFHKEKIDQILILLKEYTNRMDKEFKAIKETIVSGVILQEDFKI